MLIACSGDSTETANGGTSASSSSSSSSSGSTSGGTATCANAATTSDNTAAVVAAANALLGALTSEQQTTIAYEKTLANAQQWSNFPTTFVQRNGVLLLGLASVAAIARAVDRPRADAHEEPTRRTVDPPPRFACPPRGLSDPR